MIIFAIIVGVLIFALITLDTHLSERYGGNFDTGVIIGIIIAILMVIEICLVEIITEKPTPSAIDVYQGKTTLEYTIRDGVKVDSIVVFKKNYNEK